MSASRVYAALQVRELPAQALLRLRPALMNSPCAVIEGNPPAESICSLNARARAAGVVPGMTRVEIETVPSVVVLGRNEAEEERTKEVILEAASSFTPRVEVQDRGCSYLCVLDITGTELLFGSASVLARKLLRDLRSLGVIGTIAISENFHAARCVSLGMSLASPVISIPPGKEAESLSKLPLSVLDVNENQVATFESWGISTLGQLAGLPKKNLIARLGQEGNLLHQMAAGTHQHLFLPAEPTFVLEEILELENPVELLEALMFIVNMMLEQLVRRANARILALASVSVHLRLEGGERHTRVVTPPVASNDRGLWLKLIQMDLEMHPPAASIVHVTLKAEPGITSKVQLGLFAPQLPEPGRLEVTLARIAKIVGEDAVGRVVLKDTHHPSGFRMEKFSVPTVPPSECATGSSKTALRECRPPESITVQIIDNRPVALRFRQRRFLVECAYGPWVIGSEWWNKNHWGQSQWDLVLRDSNEETLSCCIARDLKQHRWQMVGFYD